MRAEWTTWDRRESGPDDARRRVLLLPGGMCTAGQYAELMAEPELAGVRLIAVTLPGQGGTPAPSDLGVEHYARLAAECAADLGCDAVVGHSMGATVALEMAGAGLFAGPLVLLAPSFSRADEALALRVIDRLGRVLGHLPVAMVLRLADAAVKGSPLPPERRAALVADLRRNDPRTARRAFHGYLRYLDRHGSVAPRLCRAGVPAWVVHGESGDGGMTDGERRLLAGCPGITLVTIPGPSFFTPNEEPALVASLTVRALEQVR
ncbi:alpha/beta hydrolase [Kitasatospora sp. NPDC002040]|uniref:alpha/beta fold hydrolase n=1 Tax=Kitasatospora sp. NPDC002040 TaxID=3154661 RepID=UPI0033312E7A